MKINILSYHLIFLTILIGLATSQLKAQTPFDARLSDEAKQIREQLQVFTDRSVYAVDETIHFRADHSVGGPIGTNPWSSVLYVELITSRGEAMAQGKYKLTWGKAVGAISIPTASLTGNYYLKCYTRWMRNQGPESFSYTPLKIINPYRSEVIGHTDSDHTDSGLQKASYKEGMLELSTTSQSVQGGQDLMFQVKGG